MELNLSTIILEVLNFLVLVWLLKRFLYQPVYRVIEARRAAIEQTLGEARDREQAAGKLRDEYESRLAAWQREKAAARAALDEDMRQRREQELAALQASLAAERKRADVVAEREAREEMAQRDRAALALAGRFASRLLERVSGPELEANLVALFCDELPSLDAKRRATMQRSLSGHGDRVAVATAYPLDDEMRGRVTDATRAFAGHDVNIDFGEQPELVAGICMTIGDWRLGANVRDELEFFAEQGRDGDR